MDAGKGRKQDAEASICGYLFARLNGSASLCLTASGGGLPDFN